MCKPTLARRCEFTVYSCANPAVRRMNPRDAGWADLVKKTVNMKYLAVGAKAFLLLGLIALLAPRIDLAYSIDLLFGVRTLFVILLAALILTVQSAMAAVRQIELISVLGNRISFWSSLRVWLVGLFVSQALITFVAGDVARGLQFAQEGIPRRVAGRAVILDRILGLIALLVLVMVAIPFVLRVTQGQTLRVGLYLLLAASATGIAGFFAAGLAGRFVRWLPGNLLQYRIIEIAVDLVSVARFTMRAPVHSFAIFALSIAMHILNVVCIILIARVLGATAPVLMLGAVTIPALLIAMLPISFAGWGVREAAMVTGFGLLGIPASIALATSLAFGLTLVIASVPGAFALARRGSLHLALRRRSK